MAQKLDIPRIETFCTELSEALRDIFPFLDVHFLLHTHENKSDKIEKLLHQLSGHPTLDEAAAILKFKTINHKESTFLGIVEGYRKKLMGFKTVRSTIGLVSVNYENFQSCEDAFLVIYSLTAELLESLQKLSGATNTTNLNNTTHKKQHLIQCKTKLKADIYAALQMVKCGFYDTPQRLARRRCIETLTPQSHILPELYSFPIALDVIHHALDNQILMGILANEKSHPITAQYQLAVKITDSFDAENIEVWAGFAKHCQTMAWIGYTASQILGAATNTSTDPFMKATGHLLAELTNLSPVDEEHLPLGYNPFLADEINQIRHNRQIEDIFEMTLVHAIEAESHLPFFRVAKNQNDSLMKGKIFGWCAYALQASGKAFQTAHERGIPPDQAARLEFQSSKLQAPWKVLYLVGDHVISLYRSGKQCSPKNIMDYCDTIPDSRFMKESLEFEQSGYATTNETAQVNFNHPIISTQNWELPKASFLLEENV